MEIKSYLALLNERELAIAHNTLMNDKRKSVRNLGVQVGKRLALLAEEEARVSSLWQHEKAAMNKGYEFIIGTDEAGRGPLAGPVVAAAVVLPRNCKLRGINDSKKLTPLHRDVLYEQIKRASICYGISEVSPQVIDEINILEATRLAMQDAVEQLKPIGDFILVDGWENPRFTLPQEGIIKGDSKSISIAAASILAKVHRDRLMMIYDKVYPNYGFGEHKGYPTANHLAAVKQYGPCPIHRRTFKPIRLLLEDQSY